MKRTIPGRLPTHHRRPQAQARSLVHIVLAVLMGLLPRALLVGDREQLEGFGGPVRRCRTHSGSRPTSTGVENFQQLFTYSGGIYGRWLLNSALYAFAGRIGATVLAVLAGYGFAKYRFAGRRFSFSILLGAVMVPTTALVIPTFILFSQAGLTNTVWSVILPSLLNPFGVYLLNVYARDAVPDELLDAARVDGAGEFRTFFTVALPLLRPAIVTVLLLSVVSSWNNYFLPLAMLSDNRLYPVTVGIGLWQSTASTYGAANVNLWSLVILGSLVSVIPLIIAFLSPQRYWRGGLAIGSLK